MDCPPRADVIAFFQGALRGPRWDELSTHLQTCASCQAVLSALSKGAPTSRTGEPAAPVSEPLPSRIGRYVVLEQLGQGGMGRVYSAYHPELDRRVALKVLHAKTVDEVASARLRREAQAMARLDHPNVVAVHDVGEEDGRLYLVMERVEGETLEQRLQRGPLGVNEALALLRQAGHGLVAAHHAGLVHRDFKPANVLVSSGGRVRVADFGIARFAGSSADDVVSAPLDGPSELTQPGLVAGTPAFMAPEQLRGGVADERSDQFSFCITAYKTLYGEHPFELTAPIDRRYLAPKPPPPRGEPRAVRAALLKGLSADPAARFPSMQALLTELERTPLTLRAVAPWLFAAAALAGAGVSLAAALRPPPVPGCSAEARTVSAQWSSSQRETLRRVFDEVAGPAGEAPAKLAIASFDTFAEAWEREAERACQAATAEGHGLRTPALECLDSQRLSFGATIEVLSTADRGLIDRAPLVAAALMPPARCGSPGAASSTPRLPTDPALLAPVQKVRLELATVAANNLAGRPEKAVALLGPLQTEAKRLGFKPLIGEVAFATVETRTLSMSAELALDAAQVAFTEAVAAGMDATAADTAAILAYLNVMRDKPELASEWLTVSRALLERAGGDPLVEARLENSISVVLDAQGKTAEGHPHQVRAAELRSQVLGPRHPRTLSFMSNVAASYVDLCREPEARAVLAVFDDPALARQLPGMASAGLERLAGVLLNSGEWREAERVARLTIEADADERATTRRAAHHAVLGGVLNAQGRREEALATADEALAILGDSSANWAANQHVLFRVAGIYLDNARVDDARKILARLPVGTSEHPSILGLRARLALPGDVEQARRFITAARAAPACKTPVLEASLALLEAEAAAMRHEASVVQEAKARAVAALPAEQWPAPMKLRLAALPR